MADGTRKPIKDVKLGDWVMAKNPITGVRGPRKVIDLIRHTGPHTMVKVRLADGTTIDATDGHPFWVQNEKAWVDAINLEPGDVLLEADGDHNLVFATTVTRQDLTAYNLTVDDLHTYYVLAGGAPVLVHNSKCDRNALGQFTSVENADAARGRLTHKNYRTALGSGYDYEFTLPSGLRPDAIDWENRIVRELKSDAPSSMATGRRQLAGYVAELEELTGQSWSGQLDIYSRY